MLEFVRHMVRLNPRAITERERPRPHPYEPPDWSFQVHPVHPVKVPPAQPRWCWAACTEMVLKRYGNMTKDQCNVASDKLSEMCCTLPRPQCNRYCTTEDVEDIYTSYGIHCVRSNGREAFQILKSETDSGRPVEIGIIWQNGLGDGHLIIAWKTSTINGQQLVHVNDPDPSHNEGVVLFSDLNTAYYGDGVWCETWTNIHG